MQGNQNENEKREVYLTAGVTKTLRSSSFGQQGAEPASVQPSQPEPPQAERAVVLVQAQTGQQQDDCGSVSSLHAHRQRLAEVLLMGSSADQELQQLQGTAPLTHLTTEESRYH